MTKVVSLAISILLVVIGLPGCRQQAKVGAEGLGHRVATSQLVRPVGTQVEFDGRPVDLALARGGDRLLVKDHRGLVVIDLRSNRISQQLGIRGGSSLHGIAVDDSGRAWFTDAASGVHELLPQADGSFKAGRTITLPEPKAKGAAYGCGIAVFGSRALVCASRSNALIELDLDAGRVVRSIESAIAPFDVVLSKDRRFAFVSCWGGRTPKAGTRRASSSGTDVEVDARGIAKGGVVSIVDLKTGSTVAHLPVGLQPSDLALDSEKGMLYVACANSDTVAVIDTRSRKLVRSIVVRPDPGLMFGSAPNALALSPDSRTLYVALGNNNAIAVVDLGAGGRVAGLIPAGWYPGAILQVGNRLCVANVKGIGSRRAPRADGGHSVYSFRGTVGLVEIPGADELARLTLRAKADANVPDALRAVERSRSGTTPVPIPAKLGDRSVIEHVVYVIKENRTYDQVFGDLPQGDGEPKLCVFGRDVTPNHHALAERYVLLDNYYCNGVNSADGHAWSVEGVASSYLEKSFGGWTRSYPFGDDPLSYASSGFIWDHVLAAGLTFRNYGEFDAAKAEPNGSFIQIYRDFLNGTGKFRFKQSIGVERLRGYSNPDYPGWNMAIPDVLRAKVFTSELARFEGQGRFPSFTIVYLPQDHNSGTSPGSPTPRAHMADNDLALGRVVDALSRTRFWKKMAIFVIEDDPQNGFDHVDGHRSICLVVSPHAKRGQVVSKFYNQSSVLHSIGRILGVPPMNQMQAQAPLMSDCFTSKPDFAPYRCLPARVALSELNPRPSASRGAARYWAMRSAEQDLSRPDAGPDDLRNRMLWFSAKGSAPYPAEFAGAHGRGLGARKLAFATESDDD